MAKVAEIMTKRWRVTADWIDGGPSVVVAAKTERDAKRIARPLLEYGWKIGKLTVEVAS